MQENGLVKVFNNAVARILDFLLIHEGWDYSKSQIAEYSGVAYKTVYDVWPVLEKYGLVKHTRNVGRSKMYKINSQNKIVKTMKKMQALIMLQSLEAREKKAVKIMAK